MRALLAVATLLISGSLPAVTAVTGESAPDFALRTTSGEKVRLSEFRGEVVLLTFWADWCGRCNDQLHDLDALQARYAARGLRVLAVNIDRHSDAAREAAARHALLVLHDQDQEVARQYQLGDLPLTMVVDQHGMVRQLDTRYRPKEAARYAAQLAGLLDEILPQTAARN